MKTTLLLFLFLCIFSVKSFAQSYEDYIQQSYSLVDSGRLEEAKEALEAGLRLEPANRYNYALLSNLGTIQRRLGEKDDALISYSAALAQQPKSKIILENLGELYSEMGLIENAIGSYNTILSLDPKDEEALYSRGILYIQDQNYLLAEADFEQILAQDPETLKGRLGFAILERARGRYDESEIILNYLLTKTPDWMRIYEERAELYFITNKKGKAASDINRVFAETPDPSADMYVLRGQIKLARFEKESAAIDFKKAESLGYNKETIQKLMKLTY